MQARQKSRLEGFEEREQLGQLQVLRRAEEGEKQRPVPENPALISEDAEEGASSVRRLRSSSRISRKRVEPWGMEKELSVSSSESKSWPK